MRTFEMLDGLSSNQWQNLFTQMEREQRQEVDQRGENLLYRYLGEIDCPEEMLSYFATSEDIAKAGGKTNWFICSDGSFFTCGDCSVDYILEGGNAVDYQFPFEEEREQLYGCMSKDEKIAYRMSLQGITNKEAKEIVCDELGISAYKYSYVYQISEEHFNDLDSSSNVISYKRYIEADNDEESQSFLSSMLEAVGCVLGRGIKYSEEDNRKMRESGKLFGYKGGTPFCTILKKREINLLEKKENNSF